MRPRRRILIVLHHTAGWFWGDIDTLTTPHYHVSVAFVVARSGWIYRLFRPTLWSSHLGTEQNVVGGSVFNAKRSIAIEISNVGQLVKNGADFTFVHNKYCGESENQYFTTLPQAYRGHKTYASFTDAQYHSVGRLLDELCADFQIPRTFLPVNKRYNVFANANAAKAYKGIASHVNFRATRQDRHRPGFRLDTHRRITQARWTLAYSSVSTLAATIAAASVGNISPRKLGHRFHPCRGLVHGSASGYRQR